MNFSSNVTTVILRDTFVTALTKNVIVVSLCLSINYINGTLVYTFFRNSIFTENPRYILYIHMVVNDMIQLTIAVLLHVLSYIFFTINVSFCCFLLMIVIFTTHVTPLNLAGMAIECYIAICHPLRHMQICTVRRTYVLIGLIWCISAVPTLPDVFVLLANEPVEFFHSRIFCFSDNLFSYPYLLRKKSMLNIMYLCFVWLILVYTYFKIIFAAKSAKSDAKKARNTILLHGAQLLMCMLTYFQPLLNSLLLIFPMHILELRFTNYVFVQILPRLVSPIVYGLRDQLFCKYLKKYFSCKYKLSQSQTNKIANPHN